MDLMLTVSNILRSPIYDMSSCVPELIASLLMPGCGHYFLDFVKTSAAKSQQNLLYFTSGYFMFDLVWWNKILRVFGSITFDSNVQTQATGTYPWDEQVTEGVTNKALSRNFAEKNDLYLIILNSGKFSVFLCLKA